MSQDFAERLALAERLLDIRLDGLPVGFADQVDAAARDALDGFHRIAAAVKSAAPEGGAGTAALPVPGTSTPCT